MAAPDRHPSAGVKNHERRAQLSQTAGLTLVVLVAIYLLVNLLDFQYGRDQGIYSAVANAIASGGAPYTTAWDFKPPGIYLAFVAAKFLFGDGMDAIRWLEVCGLVLLAVGFIVLSRRVLGSAVAGSLAALLAIVHYVELEFWHTAQPEALGCVLLTWALVLAMPVTGAGTSRRRALASWLASGALYGAAALLKPPLGGGVVVSMAFVVWEQRKNRADTSSATVAWPLWAFPLGALLPMLMVAVWLYAVGALRQAWEALFVFAPHYTGALAVESLAQKCWIAGRKWLFDLSRYNPMGLVALVPFARGVRRVRAASLHVLLVVLVLLAGVVFQGKFFTYHYATALVLTSLPAGWGYWQLLERARRSWVAAMALVATIVLIALPDAPVLATRAAFWSRSQARLQAWRQPEERQALRDRLYSAPDYDAAAIRAVADWIQTNSSPGATIFVWGFEPFLYELADRQPASRWIYNIPQRVAWSREVARAELMHDLQEKRPEIIVVQEGDVMPWVTGNALDSGAALGDFPELVSLLQSSYDVEGAIATFLLMRRR